MKKYILVIGAAALLALAGCGNSPDSQSDKKESHDEHADMNHSGSAEMPEGLEEAANPEFETGSKVTIKADHMKGMDGAEGMVTGAYDTIAYVVDYKPADGGEEVKDHKWVIQEEIKDAGDEELKPGTEVTLEADHMKGMKDAKATIVSAEKTTVYTVDYQPTDGGDMVKNHKWVVESELESE
ncbi:YdhK family protein [Rossellomorea marisflavi]|uniref:YdhK family protein n=1 Tax=Rossellomorea marisflavi TaxID=189381 RepID=UPI00135AA7D8